MTDLWQSKVTIYNDIFDEKTRTRHFNRFVVEKCQIQGKSIEKSSETVSNDFNAKVIITKDVAHYKDCNAYVNLSQNDRENYYTAKVGDFIVLEEVEDIVSNAQQFAELQKKYGDNGIKITQIKKFINGMNTDNIVISND